MPSTTNFGWTTPADTDLVKDGAAAIRTLGNGIDTSFLDLKGGTTDQVLAKNSNTDLDFKWVAQDDSNAIQNALLTTTGDTIYASAASTPARLGVGSTGQVLTIAGGIPSWATPTSGGITQLATGSLNGVSTLTLSFTITGYQYVRVVVSGNSNATGGDTTQRLRLNNVSTSDYYVQQNFFNTAATTLTTSQTQDTYAILINNLKQGGESFGYVMDISGSLYQSWGRSYTGGNVQQTTTVFGRILDLGGALSSIVFTNSAGNNWSGGTATVYGVK